MKRYHAVIIGGGGTGAAIAYDLVQRGVAVTLLERGELTSGTTGRHHGQMHCGARYAVKDREIARECMHETMILRRIAAEALEFNYGIFVALNESDLEFEPVFIESCEAAGIPTRRLSPAEALALEPNLNPETLSAVLVPDGTLDAWRLPLMFFAAARHGGADIRAFTRVTGIRVARGAVNGVEVRDLRSGRQYTIGADVVINATGAWAGRVAALAGIELPITPAPGTMVAVKGRLCNTVVSHMHPPDDGDIIVPQRGLSIIGSTQWTTDDPDSITTPEEDIQYLLRRAAEMLPCFGEAAFHAAWSATRPLTGFADGGDGRELSRDFAAVDHAGAGADGLISVTGGKATVLRAMGELLADTVCARLGIEARCRTAEAALPSHRSYY